MDVPVDDRLTTIALQRVVVGVVLVLAALALGILVTLDADLKIDVRWNEVVTNFAFLQPISLVLNFLGGGWFATFVVPLAGVAVMLVLRRPWGALFVVAASAASALGVQVLKAIFGRARPEDMIVVSDHGSFPSGHTANAAAVAAIAVVLFPRVWVALVGAAWVFAMAFSRTEVHAHWFSDTVGGALVGTGVALVVAAALTLRIDRERAALPR
ncbi:phosphatase PAP2 family protein [uncultured Microbacterium sp.]|uniref:phosphatase PAP2 family protein n=1 Tax=uncultured Microbacterium sp. TaxID=191216 RepID=UPI0026364A16|nr:phosphatase PAP2 family protein [uncultured Microbacterium sp.]